MPKQKPSSLFLLDEGVPKSVLKVLQFSGYDVKRVQDLSPRGISNGAVMNLASSSERILLTRDSDFLKLKTRIGKTLKVVYLEAHRDEPEKLASHIEIFMDRCLQLLSKCSLVVLDEDGPECVGRQ